MARKTKKSRTKRKVAKKAKTARTRRKVVERKVVKTKRASVRKTKARKKKVLRKTSKRTSALQRLENALMIGVADIDDLAESMGLLGAVEPKDQSKRRR
jgi:hypothetical protein